MIIPFVVVSSMDRQEGRSYGSRLFAVTKSTTYLGGRVTWSNVNLPVKLCEIPRVHVRSAETALEGARQTGANDTQPPELCISMMISAPDDRDQGVGGRRLRVNARQI